MYGTKKKVDPVTGKVTYYKDPNAKAPSKAKGTADAYLDYQYKSGQLEGQALENYVTKKRSEDPNMQNDYFKALVDIIPGASESVLNLQDLMNTMVSKPDDIMKQYEESGVLDNLRQDMKGYSPQEMEIMKSQKRQELASAARAGGGTRALGGQSREFSTVQSQFGSAMEQAKEVQAIDTAQTERKMEAEKEYGNLMLTIGQKQKQQQDDYQNMINNLAMNFANITSITKEG